MKISRTAWAFAVIYMVLSLGVEASLIIFGGLRVPEDNAKIAPVILVLPPILAALLAGYRGRKEFIILVVLTAVFTVAVTLTVNRITGISTGLVEPMINRSIAGFLAAVVTNRVVGTGKQHVAEAAENGQDP